MQDAVVPVAFGYIARMIVDAHLDLAYNATRGRDITLLAAEQISRDKTIPTVGLPDLRRGDVRLICGTLFAEPRHDNEPGYQDCQGAFDDATAQMDWYDQQAKAGRLKLVRSARDLPKPTDSPLASTRSESTDAISTIVLMEGGDPLRTVADAQHWFARGVRVVGMAWKRTHLSGGTGNPGPLTPLGISMVHEFDRLGIIHDASHLAEESFWQLLKLTPGPVMASHSNCRAIVPTDRQLSDEMIRAIVARGGVIGINFFDRFLIPPAEYKSRRASLDDVVHHIQHICEIAGNAAHVAIGTDMDGGLGKEQIPQEITASSDLPLLKDALRAAGFTSHAIDGIMWRNWLEFFAKNLARN